MPSLINRKNTWLLLLLLGFEWLNAQSVATSTSLLKAFYTADTGDNEMLRFLNQETQELPWIEKLEFRTETSEWDLARQEYVFRLSKNGSKERKAQRQLIAKNISTYELEDYVLQQERLFDAYDYLVDWYYKKRESDLLQRQQIILEDRRKVLQKLAENNLATDLDDFLKNESQIQAIKRNLLLLDQQMSFVQQQLGSRASSVDTSDWIGIAQMEAIVQKLSPAENQHPELFLQNAKIAEAQANHQVEEAKGKKIIDFVQVKYANRDKLENGEALSLGLGINIPSSAERVKRNRAKLKYLEEQHQARLLQMAIDQDVQEARADFAESQALYQMMQADQMTQQLEAVYQKYLQNTDTPVASLLQIKEQVLAKELLLVQTEYKLCQHYLELLATTGAMYKGPLLNYLSKDLPKIEE